MKRFSLALFFFIFLLCGCPKKEQEKQAADPVPPWPAKSKKTSPLENIGNGALKVWEADLPPMQDNPRLVADLMIAPSEEREIKWLAISGYFITSRKSEGKLRLFVDGAQKAEIALSALPMGPDPDSFDIKAERVNITKASRVVLQLDSKHQANDRVQVKILYIESNLGFNSKPRELDSILCR